MTTFMYENEDKVRELAKSYFVKETMPKVDSVQTLMVYKYILCYSITVFTKINQKAVENLRTQAVEFDCSTKNRIFFEKAIKTKQDLIFFQEYMRACEKDEEFLSTWWTWFSNVA